MPNSDSLAVAKYQARASKREADTKLVLEIMRNPIFEIVGGVVLVELLQRFPADRPIIGNWQGNALELAMLNIIAVQQLAPSLPYFAQAGSDILGTVGKLAGGATLAGMG